MLQQVKVDTLNTNGNLHCLSKEIEDMKQNKGEF